jgi:hypothetical protein
MYTDTKTTVLAISAIVMAIALVTSSYDTAYKTGGSTASNTGGASSASG